MKYQHPTTKEICTQFITVCPPKPCSDDTECDGLEVYINEINCVDEDPNNYTVELSVTYNGPNQLCFIPALPLTAPATSSSSSVITTGTLSGGQDITVKVCPPNVNCTECDDYLCIKTIRVNSLEDCDRDLEGSNPSEEDSNGRSTRSTTTVPQVYPNPSTDHFTIEHHVPIVAYRVYDLKGQLITQQMVNSTSTVIDLHAQDGVYLLRIVTSDEQMYHQRIIKLSN